MKIDLTINHPFSSVVTKPHILANDSVPVAHWRPAGLDSRDSCL